MSFGKLGALGSGLGRLGSRGGSNLLVAPNLIWTSGVTDNTPDLTITFPDVLLVGTIVTVQYDTSSTFSGANSVTHTLTIADVLAQSISLSVSSLADGAWYIRAKYAGSAWSNTETKAISTSTHPTFYILGF